MKDQKFIFREFPSWWKEMLADASVKKISHNAKFDLMWQIHALGGDLPIVRNQQDTMLKSQLAGLYRTRDGARKAGYPGDWEPNDLASCLDRYVNVKIKKEIDHTVTDWTGPWSPDMEAYMLEDIGELENLDRELDAELVSQGQERAAWIECGAVFAMAWMTYNGITPNIPAWEEATVEWQEKQKASREKLREYFPEVLNFNSPAQLLPALHRLTEQRVQDTKKATLKQLSFYFPEIKELMNHRHWATLNKNWGGAVYDSKGKLKKLGYLDACACKICFRFHPDWRQIGTETSRMSCSKPNLQQIPRDPEFRKLFEAAPGFLLASLDYSAIEVLTAAVFANDRALIAACATGDPHRAFAERLVGRTIDKRVPADAAIRQNAKIAIFGLLFGGGVEGMIRQARDLFDVDLSPGQATLLHRKFFSTYPGLRKTKGDAYEAMRSDPKVLEVTNAVGFTRYLQGHDRKPTTWLNTWIQSTAGYGLKSSYPYLMEMGLLPYLCMQVHDELVFEFDESTAVEDAALAKTCMIRGMQDVLGKVAVNVDDSAIGRVWL